MNNLEKSSQSSFSSFTLVFSFETNFFDWVLKILRLFFFNGFVDGLFPFICAIYCQCQLRGKVSPRAFIDYDCSTLSNPLHFRDGIMNSFHDPADRVNFLNKFYQCLVAG